MKRQTLIILLVPTVILVIASAIIMAAETGTISGQITDSQTGQPIVGATVLLVGTNRGAQTDAEGKFTIKNVPAGKYAVRVTAVGYGELEIKSVYVKSDITISINNSLTEKTEKLGEKVVVEAQMDSIDKFETSNQALNQKDANSLKQSQSRGVLDQMAPQINSTPKGKTVIRGGRPSDAISDDDDGSYMPLYSPPYYGRQYFNDMFFENYGTNPFVDTRTDYQSTFAIDIDDASFTLTRSYLNNSTLPPVDAIRVEEFINHFDYHYQAPKNETFAIHIEGAPARFGENSQLIRIGIKGKMLDAEESKPMNLVFVVDCSGSMAEGRRYAIVQQALEHVINRAQRNDKIGIVAFNQSAEVIIESTPVRQKQKLIEAVYSLYTNGSTNVQAGLRLGFQMAGRNFDSEKNNCVILFSDGVANVSVTDAERMLEEVKKYSNKGITLTTIGVGMGNYNDVLLEKLGDKGDGFYAYVDNYEEACQVFDHKLTGSLQPIARDVKIQVEFDPEVVKSYRLLGYENRDIADYQFRNDKVDGGEVTPGKSATALYEVHLRNRGGNLGRLFGFPVAKDFGRVIIRYKNPDTHVVEEISREIESSVFSNMYTSCSPDFKLAMVSAEFAEIMRDSYWARNSNLESVRQLASEVYRQTRDEKVLELVNMISRARDMMGEDSDYFSRE